ncbi:MAG: carbonic anhydrase [Actinomycetota bacterium]|nr:carbonic anhydrase [Actinomycetota bacterium]
MTATDEVVANNAAYAARLAERALPAPPRRRIAVLTCMDARIDPARALGLADGDAHVIRNAGGVATDDALRSLVLSQRLLGTEEVMVIHHTECGMEGLADGELEDAIERETGRRPAFSFGGFDDVERDVREAVRRLQASPFLPSKRIRGFVYDVRTGALREVATG